MTSAADGMSTGPVRHVILFRLYPDADPHLVLSRLRSLHDRPGVIEWRIERSLDERKGVVVMQNSLFESMAALHAFRRDPVHAQVADFMSRNADWLVADHLEQHGTSTDRGTGQRIEGV